MVILCVCLHGTSAETDSQLSFDVLYLDYQYSELLNARDIVDDVPDWIKDEPAYARKCALTGIKPVTDLAKRLKIHCGANLCAYEIVLNI